MAGELNSNNSVFKPVRNMGNFKRKQQTSQIQTFVKYTCTHTLSHTHEPTYFTQC